MIQITHLPTPDELAYNLNKLPRTIEEYQKSMKSLAASVIDYSKQIEQIFKMEIERESLLEEENGAESDLDR